MNQPSARGQTLIETALVMPLFIMVLFGIITLGIGVFYQQQLTNAAREAARYAAIHSATAACPTTGDYDPASPPQTYPMVTSPGGCDRKAQRWPRMTSAARNAVFGLPRGDVKVAACWSGYRKDTATGAIDAPPPGTYGGGIGTISSVFVQCSIGGQDPTANPFGIGCSDGLATTDQASSMSDSPSRPIANTVTAYACYIWRPPLAGFLLIPPEITLRGVVTEAIQRQQ
ncbi:MAG: pilus assembly protein [Chloroflexi bacterium]|nr:pilus assembly protein [Chloroflexota bacterium]